ncbi:MAG TPA: sugar acetyltransferase, partial [Alphaproteobacteria bacterium]
MAEPNIILLGSGGHAVVLLDVMRSIGTMPTCIADPGRERGPTDFYNLPCIGDDTAVFDRNPADVILVNGIGSISRPRQRRAVYERFRERGYHFLKLVHPAAYVSEFAEVGDGAQIMAGCVIQPHAMVGENAIINTRASIDHHSIIGAHTHIAPGVTVCG